MTTESHKLPWRGLVHLVIVYVVWGSTYLAMRETALGNFPPLTMAASRICIASVILVITVKLLGYKLALTRREAT